MFRMVEVNYDGCTVRERVPNMPSKKWSAMVAVQLLGFKCPQDAVVNGNTVNLRARNAHGGWAQLEVTV